MRFSSSKCRKMRLGNIFLGVLLRVVFKLLRYAEIRHFTKLDRRTDRQTGQTGQTLSH